MAEIPKNISTVTEVEIQASQIIERLEEAAEKAVEAVTLLENPSGKNTELLEADLGLKGSTWNVNQGFLQTKSKDVPQILSVLEDLIVFENDEGEESDAPTVTSLTPLSSTAKFTFVLQSVVSFANTLDRNHLSNLNNKIHNDTTKWINNLFRLCDSQAFYHDEPLEGLVRLARMLLHYKYPKYLESGFECLNANPPVIYSTIYSSLGIVQHLCRQLGLSLSCIHAIPCANNIESQQRVDINSFEKMVSEDKASSKIPLLLLADAGTPVTGHVDDLVKLQEICHREGVWLHIRGHNLAALSLVNINKPLKLGDSMTLPLGAWLGIPGLPTITLYQQIRAKNSRTTGVPRETTLPLIAGLVADQIQRCLVSLPVWFTLQAVGKEEILSRIKDGFEITENLYEKLSKYSCLRLLSHKPKQQSGLSAIQDLIAKPVSSVAVRIENIISTIVFQFVPAVEKSEAPYTSCVPQYYNKLNSWLGQILQRDVPQMNVEICELEYAGVVLRVCPLEAIIQINSGDIELFVHCLDQQLDILSATVRLKSFFRQSVTNNPQLQLVEMEGWAGLGGVRYVPQNLENVDAEQCKQEVNKLNIEIVNKLRATDAAFSLGQGNEGLVCVRFGMVTADTDVEELLTLVTSIGKNVEESSKYLETMVEIVKKGIETATMDLQKENEERLWQEGILRHVPVFGSIVNWWSPKSKESGIKGRSLNLQAGAGVVESTENIYRYHMQLQQGASSPPGSKSPPQPLVQTPIVTDSSSKHSRSSSHSSQISQKSSEQKNNLPVTESQGVGQL